MMYTPILCIKCLYILTFIVEITNAGSRACKLCNCFNDNLDCTRKNFDQHLDTELKGETFNEVIFDINLIVHLKAFPVFTANKLSLKYNAISVIDKAAFREVINLTEIDLSHNHITTHALSPHCFMGKYSPEAYEPLATLKVLKLSSNSLHSLHPDLFEHLPNLRKLSLDFNPFKMIDKPTSIAIASLLHLEFLDLSSTKIYKLPATMLHTPRFLEVLNLSSNAFTSVPASLGEAEECLKILILDNNPITEIDSFPTLKNLEVLHMNYMPNLMHVNSGALQNLARLDELSIVHSFQFEYIAEDALVSETSDWPPLKKLYLNNNLLEYLGEGFLARWDHLEELDLSMNPWVCDCDNQWFLSTLIPQTLNIKNNKSAALVCEEPIEMRGRLLMNLYKEKVDMRCLDTRGARPEKDAVFLVGLVITMLIALPILLSVFVYYHKVYRHVPPIIRLSYRRPSFVDNTP